MPRTASIWCVLAAFAVAGTGRASGQNTPAPRQFHQRNSVGVFQGWTRFSGEDAYTVGIDYERRISRYLGIGGSVEYAIPPVEALAVLAPFTLHAYRELRFWAAPGVGAEFERALEPQERTGSGLVKPTETFAVLRLGAGYDFEFRRWVLTPLFEVDFFSGKRARVAGVTIGHEF